MNGMSDLADGTRKPAWTPGLALRNAFAFAANVLALYGVLRWNWDTFQILILYWCETATVALWALAKLWFLPETMLGTMTVNGKVVPATNRLLLEMFVMVFGIFLAVHLGLLWVFFSAGSVAAGQGPARFVHQLVVASAAWLPLLLAFVAGFMDFLRTPKRESFVLRIERHFAPDRRFIADAARDKSDGVGPAIASPLIRIVLMQVAVIFGAMMVRTYGTDVPFYLLIGLKTLIDIQRPS
jgi:hypothetical protein